jgi:hypothetical protein
MPSFRREVKLWVPCRRLKNPCDYMEVGSKAKFVGHFLPERSSFANRGLRAWAGRGSIKGSTLAQHGHPWSWRRKLKRSGAQRASVIEA